MVVLAVLIDRFIATLFALSSPIYTGGGGEGNKAIRHNRDGVSRTTIGSAPPTYSPSDIPPIPFTMNDIVTR